MMTKGSIEAIFNKQLFYMRGNSFDEIVNILIKEIADKSHLLDEKNELRLLVFQQDPSLRIFLQFMDKYILICKFLAERRPSLEDIEDDIIYLRKPELIASKEHMDSIISSLKHHMSLIEKDLKDKIAKFTPQECNRLDEALVAYSNYCYFSSTIMAISALESRLHQNIKLTNEDLYLECFEKATLGQIIQIFEKNSFKNERYSSIKRLMPDKHYPLVQLLNEYRIISAHPKGSDIPPQVAESILSLSFNFLIDPEMNISND